MAMGTCRVFPSKTTLWQKDYSTPQEPFFPPNAPAKIRCL